MNDTPTLRSGFDAYAVALELVAALRPLVPALEAKDRELATQLRRAATSVPLNLAEARKRRGKDRLHLWRVAAGSAAEVRAALETAVAWGYLAAAATAPAATLIDRELAMLWRLTR
jgi:four helix bundle protein